MNKKYKLEKIINDRYVVWYMPFPKKKGNRIGVYKIYDLYSTARNARFAFRYTAREGQSQLMSDDNIISTTIANFNKKPNRVIAKARS